MRIFDSLIKLIVRFGQDIKRVTIKKSIDEMFEMQFKGRNDFDKIVRFGQDIKCVTIKSLSMKCLKCSLKVIMNLIRIYKNF